MANVNNRLLSDEEIERILKIVDEEPEENENYCYKNCEMESLKFMVDDKLNILTNNKKAVKAIAMVLDNIEDEELYDDVLLHSLIVTIEQELKRRGFYTEDEDA